MFILIFTITNCIFVYVFPCKYDLSCIVITDVLGSPIREGFLTPNKVCLFLQDEVRCNDQHPVIGRKAAFFENYSSFVIYERNIKSSIHVFRCPGEVISAHLNFVSLNHVFFFFNKGEH